MRRRTRAERHRAGAPACRAAAVFALAALLLPGLVACASSTPVPLPPAASRPRDPWVFPTELDGRAQLVAIALHDDLWVAYDTETCTPVKAWRDGVAYDAADASAGHTTSVGDGYRTWHDGSWWLVRHGVEVPLEARWLGHEFRAGNVALRYELSDPDGAVITVEEVPERVARAATTVSFARIFVVSGMPVDAELKLMTFATDVAPSSTGLDGAGPGPVPIVDVAIPADGAQVVEQVWSGATAPPPNVLSDAERALGWELLFDGETTRGWRGFRRDDVPGGWEVIDGCLVRTGSGGDIVTEEAFGSFELALQWKIQPGGNSGIFYRVGEDADHVWETGPEMQVLDDAQHPDGADPLTSAGANYALHAPAEDVTRPVGEFNDVLLRVQGDRVEHWLNGTRVVAYELGSDDWTARVAASKFASMPAYGTRASGHIALQDHGDRVWYRDLKVRRLDD